MSHDDRGTAQVTDDREQVAGDISAGDGGPAYAALAVPAQVGVGHPMAGLGQLRGQEPVDLAVVADSMRQYDERPVAGNLTCDPAAIDVQEFCHWKLTTSLSDLHQVKPR
jgi:hypothetical protein